MNHYIFLLLLSSAIVHAGSMHLLGAIGYEEGGASMSVYNGDIATVNKGIVMRIAGGVSVIESMLDLRVGVSDCSRFSLASSGFDTYYVDALALLLVTNKLHIGAGVRYDVLPELKPYDTTLPHQAIGATTGKVYLIEYVAREKVDYSHFEGQLYLALRYTQMDFVNGNTVANGNSIGYYIGVYYKN